ncbi:FAD-binding protein, partial [Limnohabitans sp.]
MFLEKNVPLQPYNTFGIAAKAQALVRVRSEGDLLAVLADPEFAALPRQILGGGSNIVLTGDVKALVLKIEVPGMRLARETDKHWVIEAGAGEDWHALVAWTLDNAYPGLENMALIPGTVGASPVQNIGAYGVELQDRFDSLDAMDLLTGELFSLNAAQCGFSYRDSVFKHASGGPDGLGLAGRAVILRVRFALPKRWKAELGYLDLERKMAETGIHNPDARQIFDWVVAIRRAKLP